jgi:hypothetical protein
LINSSRHAERFDARIISTSSWKKKKMRACFLGQNICALGYGVATLQAPPLVMDTPVTGQPPANTLVSTEGAGDMGPSSEEPRSVTNPPRPDTWQGVAA